MRRISKSSLAIALSRLRGFEQPQVSAEQYALDPEVAATVLWHARMAGDVEGRRVADFGCGTGILGIGCLLLGASEAVFVDADAGALETLRQNLAGMSVLKRARVVCMDVAGFKEQVDAVFQNPPFGTKRTHADREFLEKAMEAAGVVYSFHKLATRDFVEKTARQRGFSPELIGSFALPLRKSYSFHRKPVVKVEAGCWRMQRQSPPAKPM